MKVMIVESNPELALLWAGHLERSGADVLAVGNEADAVKAVQARRVDVIVLNLVLDKGSAFAVADFASYCQLSARVIFVTNTAFFSDGSIFLHIPNACAFLPSATKPEDLAAVIDHYGGAG